MARTNSTPERNPSPLWHFGHPDADHIPFFELPRNPSKFISHKKILVIASVGAAIAFLGREFEHLAGGVPPPSVGLVWVLPFVLLLTGIASMPFLARHFWEKYYHHFSLALAFLVATYYIFVLPTSVAATGFFARHAGPAIAGSLGEFISFIFLIGSLFIVSGGIVIRVRRTATPALNTLFLLAGAILANIFGTTGAAMLLIRPYLRINKNHLSPYHIVFFIFLVANIGGSLTPIGDPPLFLGYLKGVPFWWVLQHCWPMWCVAVGILLALFFVIDTIAHRKKARAPHDHDDLGPAVSIFGVSNLLLIAGILIGVLAHEHLVRIAPLPWRELIMVAAVSLSLWSTPHRLHVENVFNFAPIKEVAFLFVGIFATMVPALNYLSNHATDPALEKALQSPGQFYFFSGTLSAILDNAPTYATFLQLIQSRHAPGIAAPLLPAILNDGNSAALLLAISLGSVFFGAMTYIGNGPNFMVRSIAENTGFKCPSFFGYIVFYSLPMLAPILVLIWALFLRT